MQAEAGVKILDRLEKEINIYENKKDFLEKRIAEYEDELVKKERDFQVRIDQDKRAFETWKNMEISSIEAIRNDLSKRQESIAIKEKQTEIIDREKLNILKRTKELDSKETEIEQREKSVNQSEISLKSKEEVLKSKEKDLDASYQKHFSSLLEKENDLKERMSNLSDIDKATEKLNKDKADFEAWKSKEEERLSIAKRKAEETQREAKITKDEYDKAANILEANYKKKEKELESDYRHRMAK